MHLKYRLGLDIGTTSIGWSILEHDEEENPIRIVDLGVRIFDKAENPENGASLSLPRRTARGARRRLRRHKFRLQRIKKLIISEKIISKSKIDKTYNSHQKLKSIYELRTDALGRPLNNEELSRVLINLAQRRGFKSNRKEGTISKEDGKALIGISENSLLMKNKGYQTIGEMFFLDEKFKQKKRNSNGEYNHTVARSDIIDEARKILDTQLKFKSSNITPTFIEKYIAILSSQRPFDLGPGDGSPYGGDLINKMVGTCTFEIEEKRAAKATLSFDLFRLWQSLNNLKILSYKTQEPLTLQQKNLICKMAYQKDLKYSDLRNILNISDESRFNLLHYDYKKSMKENESQSLRFLQSYHIIRKKLDKVEKGLIKKYNQKQIDEIAKILTIYKDEEKISNELLKLGLQEKEIYFLSELSFSKFGHLSIKAITKILPFLEEGLTYDQACSKAGYEHCSHARNQKNKLSPNDSSEFKNITNPSVIRAISQTIKVVNAITIKYGSPQLVSIELAREMGQSSKERRKNEYNINLKRKDNDIIKEQLKEEGLENPRTQDLIKLKLWQEQDGICLYSGKTIKRERLFEIGYVEIDHIVPYSISFNDSFQNKVLVHSAENRQKGNRLPIEYLRQTNSSYLDKYKSNVISRIRDFKKRDLLLKEKITEEDRTTWKDRALNDTKYISRFLSNYLRDFMSFTTSINYSKKPLRVINGQVTAYMRRRWGISKIREDGDKHHALDATVIACISDDMIQKITKHYQYKDQIYRKLLTNSTYIVENFDWKKFDREKGIAFPQPWEGYTADLEKAISDDIEKPIFISRMPRHKNTGQAHLDTFRSAKYINKGITVVKTDLKKLKINPNTGEIKGYFRPENDIKLYQALKEQLLRFEGKGEKAFTNVFTYPGQKKRPVYKVKTYEKSTLNVPILKGNAVAANGDMIRIDIFHNKTGYYMVPIYVSDTVKSKLPNKACISRKEYSEWKEMDDEDFIFSLHPNDLIYFEHRSGAPATPKNKNNKEKLTYKSHFAYYSNAGISTSSITLKAHDNKFEFINLGIKSLVKLEKYQVDLLGNYHKVKKETRQVFNKI